MAVKELANPQGVGRIISAIMAFLTSIASLFGLQNANCPNNPSPGETTAPVTSPVDEPISKPPCNGRKPGTPGNPGEGGWPKPGDGTNPGDGWRPGDETDPGQDIPDETKKRIVDGINQHRTAAGLNALTWNAEVATAGQRWADYLGRTGLFEHDTSGYYYNHMGENLFVGPDPLAAVNAWINSPGHDRAMLWRDHTQIGLGIAKHPQYGYAVVLTMR